MSRLRMRACNFSSCSDEALHDLQCLLSKPNFNRSVVCVRMGMRASGHCYIFFCAFVAYADVSACVPLWSTMHVEAMGRMAERIVI